MKKYLLIVIGLYILSLCLPAAVLTSGTTVSGFYILKTGLFAIMELLVAWYANIFGIIAFVFAYLKNEKATFIFSTTAFILGLQSFFWNSFYISNMGMLDYLTIGFYLWELSFFVLSIHSLLQIRKRKSMRK